LLAESVNGMVSCAKQISGWVAGSGLGPGRLGVKHARRFGRALSWSKVAGANWPFGRTFTALSSQLEDLATNESNHRQEGMKIEPFCWNPRLRL